MHLQVLVQGRAPLSLCASRVVLSAFRASLCGAFRKRHIGQRERIALELTANMRVFDGRFHSPFDFRKPTERHAHAGIEPSRANNIFFRGPNAVTPSSRRSSSPISRKASISTSALVNVSV